MKTVLPIADFVMEGYVDPPSLRYGVTSPRSPCEIGEAAISRGEPLRDEGPFGDHTGYYTLAETKISKKCVRV